MVDFVVADGRRVHLIGDPHLGKNFDTNAPTHRKGERAVKQMAQFQDELRADCDVNVMVGDLFDTPYVPQSVIVSAARAFLGAAEDNPDTLFIAMAGNHDVPRNLSAVGAWVSFTKMLEDRLPNLRVLRSAAIVADLALFPWDWTRSALQQVQDVAGGHAVACVGHWDLQLYGDDDTHLAPTEALAEAFPDAPVYSGHYHLPGVYPGGVICTGSMQPVSHGEDPDELFYVTRPLAEVLANPELYRDKHVRVMVKPGEEIPHIDCLAVTHQRVRNDEEVSQISLSLDNFDWEKRLRERVATLAAPVREFIIERMPHAAPEEQRGSGDQVGGQGEAAGDTSVSGVEPSPSV